MIELLVPLLDEEDDPEAWRVVVAHILGELPKTPGTHVRIGRCSHWLRPHQTRWSADGGFAWPTGYGGRGYSRLGLPQFDWSIEALWTGDHWEPTATPVDPQRRSSIPSLRVAIPSRTTRHQQAAVHTLWTLDGNTERRFFGFRKKDGIWRCTAESDWRTAEHWLQASLEEASDDSTDDPGPRPEESLSETDWLNGTDPKPLLKFIWKRTSSRKMRLFAVACCRRIWSHLTDDRSKAAVEVSERFADGLATPDELHEALSKSRKVPGKGVIDEPLSDYISRHPSLGGAEIANARAADAASLVAFSDHPVTALMFTMAPNDTTEVVYAAHGFNEAARSQELATLCDVLRDIVANPFSPVTFEAAWLTPAIVRLARTICDERSFSRMPELADALELAGCTNEDVLDHCRTAVHHVRGCWVVDSILGKV